MDPKIKILIVEDDPQISKSLEMALTYAGYEVKTAERLAQAREQVHTNTFQILLLDVNLPDGNGLDFCHEIRSSGNDVPTVFLSARTDEETVVKSMEIGADDYIRKPFGMEELKARMTRAMKRAPPPRQIVEAGPLKMDIGGRKATLNDKVLNIGRREFDVLFALCKKNGDVVTRENIISHLPQGEELFDRTIDSHISHLRRKLQEAAGDNVQILPVYGVGYRLHWKA